MGWGTTYESSWPAQLDFMLPDSIRVLNLGLNGYGTIGAMGKSRKLSADFPPDALVYLVTSNDYNDDDSAYRYSRMPVFIKRAYDFFNVMRHHSYTVSLPYALRWWLYYSACLDASESDFVSGKQMCQSNPDTLIFKDTTMHSNRELGKHSKTALLETSMRYKSKNIPFIVLFHGDSSGFDTQDYLSFCRENGIEAYWVDIPESFRLRKDGHFNHLGNYRMAEFVKGILSKHGI
jgi:hypothetical protein